MKTFRSLFEAKKDTVVFFFGRCNPPTPAHVLLFNIVVQTAKKLGADYNIVISRTQDSKKNPLNITQKLSYLKIQAPEIEFTAATDSMRTPIEVLKYFDKKYKNVVMIAGSDRVDEFQKLFDSYNGKEYKFLSIKVVSAGERDPDSDEMTGMSSTKMRAAASSGNYATFKKGLMPHVRDIDGKRMMNDTRVGLGLPQIKESIKFDTSEIREKYRTGEIFKEGSFVESDSIVYKIINRNSNYLTLVNESGIMSKKWLTDIEECEPSDEIKNKFGEITEMKFSSGDKIKVAKIIGGMLGADVEKSTNPEQIVNAGLRIAKNKPLNDEAISIIQKMLKTADDAGIKYDTSLVPSKVTEDVESLDENNSYKELAKHADKLTKQAHKTHTAEDHELAAYAHQDAYDAAPKNKKDYHYSMASSHAETANESTELEEVLTAEHPASKWIDDFVNSDNPKFAGKSKEKRKEMALAAYYAAQKKESTDEAREDYAHQIARKVHKENPNHKSDDDILDHASKIIKSSGDKWPKHDEDFASDVVNSYAYHKKQKVAEATLGNKEDYEDFIKRSVEEAHVKGQRHVTLYKEHQTVADAHHAFLNSLGGPQVHLPHGHTMGAPADTGYGRRKIHYKRDEAVEAPHTDEDLDFTDQDIEDMVAMFQEPEDILDAYDDDEIHLIDAESGESHGSIEDMPKNNKYANESVELNEVLTRLERIKASIRMKVHHTGIERKLKIALARHSSAKKLSHRARVLAIKAMKTKIARKPLSQLTIQDKERIERIIAKRKNVINRIALKLIPRVRKLEQTRLSHPAFTQPA